MRKGVKITAYISIIVAVLSAATIFVFLGIGLKYSKQIALLEVLSENGVDKTEFYGILDRFYENADEIRSLVDAVKKGEVKEEQIKAFKTAADSIKCALDSQAAAKLLYRYISGERGYIANFGLLFKYYDAKKMKEYDFSTVVPPEKEENDAVATTEVLTEEDCYALVDAIYGVYDRFSRYDEAEVAELAFAAKMLVSEPENAAYEDCFRLANALGDLLSDVSDPYGAYRALSRGSEKMKLFRPFFQKELFTLVCKIARTADYREFDEIIGKAPKKVGVFIASAQYVRDFEGFAENRATIISQADKAWNGLCLAANASQCRLDFQQIFALCGNEVASAPTSEAEATILAWVEKFEKGFEAFKKFFRA